MDTFDEYIERTCVASDFSQRDVRDRIRNHLKLVTEYQYLSVPIRCNSKLLTLSDAELVAYDEYLNCMINAFFFSAKLLVSDRFTYEE